ncbi:hypothetical protein B9Q13_03490 [Candidatus Marsarchaeota G2 archaeon ECH_B_SAG-G16]|jgi:Predicted ICC-like phosphoesterases|uniref:Calcineurin-like phosphoesterase domain-containing protein n=3 Tax=Candidatus Marsarchaeota TaxID=1978152 RepID=A0A2R6ADI2_9ARCH|nr:MAG: hypothetical protein B9Q01_00840 [Candidatus Marsarchaeota G1 archaeon OSP_D]PSN89156.1 MAG: hypothetical protein B9Q00_02765 [Candidatus Marsarchaeota G1 archaeon OSP_C]PSO04811.1 MAG: hypothetical protein B9Q13_03490 [Candidatus Marsarchaeota G2 archaeon ECH_B_SAG-G16]
MVPLINNSAIFFEKTRTLLISELHLGFGLKYSAIFADTIFNDCLKRLDTIIKTHKIEYLIVGGDVKEKIGKPSKKEGEYLQMFEKFLLERSISAVIVKGNHDGLIENYVNFKITEFFTLNDGEANFCIFHGHKVPPVELQSFDHLLMAHIHPSVRIDGSKSFVWVFLKKVDGSRPKSVIIMPPFNKFVGGGNPKILQSKVFSKILGGKSWKGHLVSVDGVYLGEFKPLFL